MLQSTNIQEFDFFGKSASGTSQFSYNKIVSVNIFIKMYQLDTNISKIITFLVFGLAAWVNIVSNFPYLDS